MTNRQSPRSIKAHSGASIFLFANTLVLAVVPALSHGATGPQGSVSFSEIEQSVVKVVVVGPNGINSVGTGFFVADGKRIATAAHVYLEAARAVVEGGGQMSAYKVLRDGHRWFLPVEYAAADFVHDVALLKFDPSVLQNQTPPFTAKALAFEGTKPEIGDPVAFVGYFAGDEFPLLSRTTIAGYTSAPPIPEQLILDLPANPGQSGSPVFDLRTGKVVGVLASFVPVILVPGSLPTHSGLSRSVEVEHLKRLIESAEVR
jgi:S1-C subfamily serine protease